MNMWIRKTISVGAIAVGIIAVSGGTAQASDNVRQTEGWTQTSTDNSGILSGINLGIPINIALNACGNGVGVLGGGVGVSDACAATATQG